MSSPAMPYVGSRISLISKSEIRYEGILYVINTEESTIALQNVRGYGTEGRTIPEVPPTDEVYDFIIFRGEDIKDLTVLEGSAPKPSQRAVLEDPAVVSVGPERKAAPTVAAHTRDSGHREHRGNIQHHDNNTRRDYDRSGNGPQQRYNNQRGVGQSGSGYRQDTQRQQHQSFQRPPPQQQQQQYQNRDQHPRRDYGGKGYGKAHASSQSGAARKPYYSKPSCQGPVGELSASENAQTKAMVSEEFDFSSANEKFEKPPEVAKDESRSGYSKVKSFFDDISCDALQRATNQQQGGFDSSARDKQREVDRETFGASANTRPFGYGNRRFQKGGKGGPQSGDRGTTQRAY